MPLTLTPAVRTWRTEWQPLGDDTIARESAVDWWARLRGQLPPLDPLAFEQWMHRHWAYSPYFGLSLDGLSSRRVSMRTSEVMAHVGSPPNGLADPEPRLLDAHYAILNQSHLRDFEPMRSMNATGTWNMPILVIRSLDGFIVYGREYGTPLWLIEGHQRLRYLKVLAHRNLAAEQHELVELQYDVAS